MTIRRRKHLLYATTALLALLAMVCVGAAVWVPVTTPDVETDASVSIRSVNEREAPDDDALRSDDDWPELDRATLQRVARLPLRRTLFDEPEPKPEPQTPEPEPTPTISIQLIGIAHEPGHSIAILRTSDGSSELCEQDQTFTDQGATITVTSIGPRNVTLDVGGERRELNLPEER